MSDVPQQQTSARPLWVPPVASVATLFVLADLNLMIGWIGLGSLVLIALYFAGIWLIQREGAAQGGAGPAVVQPGPEFPSLRRGLIGFLINLMMKVRP